MESFHVSNTHLVMLSNAGFNKTEHIKRMIEREKRESDHYTTVLTVEEWVRNAASLKHIFDSTIRELETKTAD
jgi:hypothetical protein